MTQLPTDKKEAETKNFKVVDSISKKTSIVVVGDLNLTSTKVEKAQEYNNIASGKKF